MILKYYKINDCAVTDPGFATDGSACFDLRSDLTNSLISGFVHDGKSCTLETNDNGNEKTLTIPMNPNIRWMIPSGLIFDIPTGFHMAVHMRGGTGLKKGLHLANSTGIVDDDYTKETFLLLQNLSGSDVTISHNERLCQARLIKNEETKLVRIKNPPNQKTQRIGGFNSTGIK